MDKLKTASLKSEESAGLTANVDLANTAAQRRTSVTTFCPTERLAARTRHVNPTTALDHHTSAVTRSPTVPFARETTLLVNLDTAPSRLISAARRLARVKAALLTKVAVGHTSVTRTRSVRSLADPLHPLDLPSLAHLDQLPLDLLNTDESSQWTKWFSPFVSVIHSIALSLYYPLPTAATLNSHLYLSSVTTTVHSLLPF